MWAVLTDELERSRIDRYKLSRRLPAVTRDPSRWRPLLRRVRIVGEIILIVLVAGDGRLWR
ncbi:MAG TPA: hypothetical protein VF821_28095 [Lentzea sp.]